MTVTIEDDDSDSGFTIRPARSRRIGAEKIADVEFADDVALVTDTIEGAKLLLDSTECGASGDRQLGTSDFGLPQVSHLMAQSVTYHL